MRSITLVYFKFIESCALEKGFYKANELMECFGIARQQASRIFQEYNKNHDGNFIYDISKREYVPTLNFKPHYIKKKNALYFLKSCDQVFKD